MFVGGLQNSNHVYFIKPLLLSEFSLSRTFCFSLGVMSSVRGLYTVLSLRCDMVLLI